MKFPEDFRWQAAPHGYESSEGDKFGVFRIPGRYSGGRYLHVIACDGTQTGWEHVSVSVVDSQKQPAWSEMCVVKRLFWNDSECVVQFHPPEADYVNNHPGVLHLWRCVNQLFPMPPQVCV